MHAEEVTAAKSACLLAQQSKGSLVFLTLEPPLERLAKQAVCLIRLHEQGQRGAQLHGIDRPKDADRIRGRQVLQGGDAFDVAFAKDGMAR